MKAHRFAVVAMTLGLCAYAVGAGAAEAEGTGNFSLLGSFLQMIASLAVVVGVILLFSHFANKWTKGCPGSGLPRYIRLIETRHLGPKKSLMLVEVGGDYLLLGNSTDGVRLIKQVDMLEEIEVVGSSEQSWAPLGVRSNILGFMEKFRRQFPNPVAVRNKDAEKIPRFSFLRSEGGRG